MPLPQLFLFGVDLVKFSIDFTNFYALYLAISISLNLEFGYTGIPNFGKVMFIAGGAAFAGSISGRLSAFVYGVGTGKDFIAFNAMIITQIDKILLLFHFECDAVQRVEVPEGLPQVAYFEEFRHLQTQKKRVGGLLITVENSRSRCPL